MDNEHRLDKIDDRLQQLADSLFMLTATQEQTVKNVDNLTRDIKAVIKERCSQEACISIKKRLDNIESKKACPIAEHVVVLKGVNDRLKSIENTRAWIIRLIVGSVMVALLSLVIYKGGVQ